jgi:hypothetical protein
MSKTGNEQPGVDLSRLVNLAGDEVRATEKKLPENEPKDRSTFLRWSAGIGAMAALAAFYVVAGPWLLGFSEGEMRRMLVAVADDARNDIDAYRKLNGTLPPSIPNMALALVVEYFPEGDGYRLRASDGVRVVEMDSKGGVSGAGAR